MVAHMRINKFLHAVPALLGICILTVFSMTAMALPARWEAVTSRDESNNTIVEFQDLEVVIPVSWNGKVQMNITDSGVFTYHISSREAWTEKLGTASSGYLFGILYYEDESYLEHPSYEVIGSVGGGTYIVEMPSDYQGYFEDKTISAEYDALWNDMDWIISHISLKSSAGSDEDYIFPESSAAYLTEDDLKDMSADEVQMAINEIYARHHRKFYLEDVQAYFDSKSWYSGTIEPDDFDVKVMNDYESSNIVLMVERLKELGVE